MATRSAIGYLMPNGKIKATYCHWDGHPEHQLPILKEFYNDIHKVRDLIKPGSMSCLRTTQVWESVPQYNESGTVVTDENNKTVYFPSRDPQPLYHHERGDGDTPILSNNIEEALKVWLDHGCQYLYVFRTRKGWEHFDL